MLFRCASNTPHQIGHYNSDESSLRQDVIPIGHEIFITNSIQTSTNPNRELWFWRHRKYVCFLEWRNLYMTTFCQSQIKFNTKILNTVLSHIKGNKSLLLRAINIFQILSATSLYWRWLNNCFQKLSELFADLPFCKFFPQAKIKFSVKKIQKILKSSY